MCLLAKPIYIMSVIQIVTKIMGWKLKILKGICLIGFNLTCEGPVVAKIIFLLITMPP